MALILVIKAGKTIAVHADEQDYVITRYPADCEVIKVSDSVVEFPRDEEGRPAGLPEDPRPKGVAYVDLRKHGSTEERVADLEAVLAGLLGEGVERMRAEKLNVFVRVVSRRVVKEGKTVQEILIDYPGLTAEERQKILAGVVAD